MIRFNNIETAGFPVTGATLMKIDEMIGQVASFASSINGDNCIVSGVINLQNGSYSEGWIVWGGELLAFQGGSVQTGVKIVEETVTATYEDGQEKGYYTNRYATFATDDQKDFDFSDLRPSYADFAEKVFGTNGVILPWHKSVGEIPKGFAPCDGTNGTPNLGGKFLTGIKASSQDYENIGDTGGAEKVELQISEMPEHNHGGGNHHHKSFGGSGSRDSLSADNYPEALRDGSYTYSITGSNAVAYRGKTSDSGQIIQSQGGGQSHENRPPYYVVNYIMWVGF